MDCAASINIPTRYLHRSQGFEYTYIDRAFGIRSKIIFLTVNFDGKILLDETEGQARDVTGEYVPVHQIENGLHNADVTFGQIPCDVFVRAIFAVNPGNSIKIFKSIEFNIGESLGVITEYAAYKSSEQTAQKRSNKRTDRSKGTEDECADIGADIRPHLLGVSIEVTDIVGKNRSRHTSKRIQHGAGDAQIPGIARNNIVADFNHCGLCWTCNECGKFWIHVEQIGKLRTSIGSKRSKAGRCDDFAEIEAVS